MTTEEIKEQISMFDLLNQYGVTHRGNMCKCPFHGADNHPSMKVFKDGANCFTCGWNGDIFSFVQSMEHCDFKTAFKRLGGTYNSKMNNSERVINKAKFGAINSRKERVKNAESEFKHELARTLNIVEAGLRVYDPFETDTGAFLLHKKEWLLYVWDLYSNGEEVKKIDVLRVCRRVRQRVGFTS